MKIRKHHTIYAIADGFTRKEQDVDNTKQFYLCIVIIDASITDNPDITLAERFWFKDMMMRTFSPGDTGYEGPIWSSEYTRASEANDARWMALALLITLARYGDLIDA
tara:strand:- start:220 stop:543 length:324 start_codon:yes stop_codon:yes gene_type:complete